MEFSAQNQVREQGEGQAVAQAQLRNKHKEPLGFALAVMTAEERGKAGVSRESGVTQADRLTQLGVR